METARANNAGRVGRYKIVERLAIGGMAEVFLACERGGLDRLLVVKRILPHLAEDASFVEMFMVEARVSARINHPNVVQIYELGESGGFPFIAMEYVAGSTFKELLNAARSAEIMLPPAVIIDLLTQACAGAHAAHELRDPQGLPLEVVHRDLTPHNLMVTEQGLVKLVDFGIAKAAEGQDNTRTGLLKGKISYMSPEQCRQDRLDRRTDIFALGIVGWELFAGQKMLSGMSELATMQAIVTGQLPSLFDIRPDAPKAVVAVLQKALALDREDRFPTADAMRRALLEAATAEGIAPDRDRSALFVRTMLGDALTRRKVDVAQAMERTLVTLSAIAPGVPEPTAPSAASATLSQATNTAATTAGVLLGLLAVLLGVGAIVVVSAGLLWAVGILPFGDSAPAARPIYPGQEVEISMAPINDVALLAREMEPLEDYLSKATQRNIRFVMASSYSDAAARAASGAAPYAMLPHNTVVASLRAKQPIEVLSVKLIDGSESTDGYLLVRRDGGVNTEADLKGRTICYTDTLSQTGYVLPRRWLRAKGIDPDADLNPHFSGNHDQLLRDLLAGTCVVGGTFSANYQTAEQRGIRTAQLKLLDTTGTTPHDALVAGPTAEKALTVPLVEALLSLDPHTEWGRPALGEIERISGFTRPSSAYYND